MMFSVFLLCVLGLVAAQENTFAGHTDFGEYGHYTTWRKALCENNDEDMYKEMDKCIMLEEKSVIDACKECLIKALPSCQGETFPFMNAACKDLTIFTKFDDCFDEYTKDTEFKKQMEITPEIEACYEPIFEKYDMENLKDYLKNLSI